VLSVDADDVLDELDDTHLGIVAQTRHRAHNTAVAAVPVSIPSRCLVGGKRERGERERRERKGRR
jgi:hypothetical protein